MGSSHSSSGHGTQIVGNMNKKDTAANRMATDYEASHQGALNLGSAQVGRHPGIANGLDCSKLPKPEITPCTHCNKNKVSLITETSLRYC